MGRIVQYLDLAVTAPPKCVSMNQQDPSVMEKRQGHKDASLTDLGSHGSDGSSSTESDDIPYELSTLPRELAVSMVTEDHASTAAYLSTHTLPDDVKWGRELTELSGVLSWLYRHGSPEIWAAVYTSYLESCNLPRELAVSMATGDHAGIAAYLSTHTLPDDVKWGLEFAEGVLSWLDDHGSPEMWAALYTSPTVPLHWNLRSLQRELAVSMVTADAAGTAAYLTTHKLPDEVYWGGRYTGVLSWLDRHGSPEMWAALYTSPTVPPPEDLRTLPCKLVVAMVTGDHAATADYLATHILPDDVKWGGVLRWLNCHGSPEMWAALCTSPTVPLPGKLRSLPRELAVTMVTADTAGTVAYLSTHTLPDDVKWWSVLGYAWDDGSREIRAALAGSAQVPLDKVLSQAARHDDLDTTVRVCLSRRHDDRGWADGLYVCCTHRHYRRAAVELIATDGPLYSPELGRAVVRGDLDAVLARQEELLCLDRTAATCLLIIAHEAGHGHLVDGLVQARLVTALNLYRPMVEGGCDDLVERVLRQCQDVNVQDENELTPLHAAAARPSWSGHSHSHLPLLLSCGADPDRQDAAGRTALHFECRSEWQDEIRALVRGQTTAAAVVERVEGRDKMVKPTGGGGRMRVEDVRALVKAGAKVHVVDVNGQTPLHALCSQPEDNTQPEALGLLLDGGADINQQDLVGMTPVSYAALNRNEELVQELIKKQADVNIVDNYGQSPLLHCVQSSVVMKGKSSYLETARALLTHPSININWADQNGDTALSLAVGAGDVQITRLLLEHGADPNIKNKDGDTAVHSIRDVEIAKLIVARDVDLNAANGHGSTILHVNAQPSNLEVLTYLLKFDCKVNKRNNLGSTPLDTAVAIARCHIKAFPDDHPFLSKFEKVITILLEKGADIDIKDNNGDSALMTAVTEPSLLKMLLVKGAQKDTRNTMQGCLYHAVIENHLKNHISAVKTAEVIKLLIENHIDINMQDKWKRNALHMALTSENCRSDVVQILLKYDCDVAVRDSFGFMPIHYAITHKDIFQMLWNSSLPHLNDSDFNNLCILAHWNEIDKSQVIQAFAEHLREHPSMEQKPVNFTRPDEWSCTQDFTEWYRTSLDLCTKLQNFAEFHQQWLKSLQSFTYYDHQCIVKTLTSFVQKALAAVSRINPLVACKFRLSGSESEKTKIIQTNEMDALSIFTFITFDKFFPPKEACHHVLKEFVKLECKPEYREELAQVLDDDYCLSRGKLYQHYSTALSEALADPLLWEEFPTLQRITNRDIVAGNRTITPMKVRWHDDVYPYLLVDVDMVPAIDITGWWPDWASTHSLLMKHEALVVPKWKPTAVEDDCMMEVGISHWSQAFHEMPEEMRQGYRLAKAMKEVCPKIVNDKDHAVGAFLTSYMFKMVIVRLYAENYYDALDQVTKPKKDARQWAVEIYKRMEEALEEKRLSSFFIPDYNLLYDDKFGENKMLAITYSRLCQQMLTPETARHFYAAYMGLAPKTVVSS